MGAGMTVLLCDLNDSGICQRCKRRVKIFPGRKTIAQCPEPPTPEEIARRKVLCLLCEDWDATGTQGCQLIAAHERTRLTEYKQEHGHCARGCHDGKRKRKW